MSAAPAAMRPARADKKTMFERLEMMEAKYEELNKSLSSPEIVNDSAKYQKTAKAHAELTTLVQKYREYKDLTRGIKESRQMVAEETDAEMKAYAQQELQELEKGVAAVEEELKVLLLPKDPNDDKNIIVEIRAGTGGDEASLFAAELFRMYTRYAETQRWKVYRGDGLLEPGVGVGDDQLHPTQAAGFEAAQERGPERAVLAVADGEPEDLAPAVGAHAGGDHDGLGHHPVVDPGLAVGGVEEHIRKAPARPGERSRNAPTSVSRSAQIRDTSDLEMPVSAPKALTRSSTLRVDTPCR